MDNAEEMYWVISVNGWGTLYGQGTRGHAEEWRDHKAAWEHATATSRPATAQEVFDHAEWKSLAEMLGYPESAIASAKGVE